MELSDDVRDGIGLLGRNLDAQLSAMTAAMQQEMIDRIPELRGEVQLVDLLRVSVEANLAALLEVFSYQRGIEQLTPPEGAREYARRLAQRGVSVTALVRAYRVGQQMLVDWALDEWEAAGIAITRELIAELHRVSFGYIDSISEQVITEYATERERWQSQRDRDRAEMFARVVSEEGIDPVLAERVLGQRLSGRHVGIVAWAPADLHGRTGDLDALVGRLADEMGSGTPLVWPQDATTLWAWLPVGRGVEELPLEQIRAIVADADGLRMTLGSPGDGPEGLRHTHLEARAAHRVAAIGNDQLVTGFAEPGVRAAALLAGDLPSTRTLVSDTLGDLAAETAAAARLRTTLLVLLEEGGSYVTTSERLHLHKNTVKYRVRKALELRGRPLEDDRLDLELALIACARLGPAVHREPRPQQ